MFQLALRPRFDESPRQRSQFKSRVLTEEIALFTATHSKDGRGSMVNVNACEDIEFLVKESEVITGRRGRKFVISGADQLVYLIQWSPDGYKVQRLDNKGNATSTLYVQPEELGSHSLGEALRAGQLYTHQVHH